MDGMNGSGGGYVNGAGASGAGSYAGGQVRALVADGVPAVRQGVRLLLSHDTEVRVIGEVGSGPEALALIRHERPDLVLLDAQLPRMSGLEVAARLAVEGLPAIVFLSSCQREALDAFRAQGLDYLLKPFEGHRFFDAVRRAKVRIRLSRTLDLSERVLAAYREVSGGTEPPPLPPRPEMSFQEGRPPADRAQDSGRSHRRLLVRDAGRAVLIDVDEIDWIEAADYYVQLHVGPRTYLHRETMQRLESELDPARFVRIHRSAIVNQERIRELRHQGRREMVVVLSGGAELRVARSQRRKLGRAR